MTLLIPNSTQVPNFLLDKILPVVNPAEWKVITFVCRKTYGWQKREDRISLTQFERGTKLSRPWLVKILARLTKSGLLLKNSGPGGDIYGFNLECDVTAALAALCGGVELSSPVNSINQLTQLIKTGSVSSPQLVNSVNTQKPKETKKPICEDILKRHAESKNKKAIEPSQEGLRLARLLHDEILRHKPDSKIDPGYEPKWAIIADQMLHLDKRTPEQVTGVIHWVAHDDFEASNVRSMDKLRKRFDQLELKRRRTGNGNGRVNGGPSAVNRVDSDVFRNNPATRAMAQLEAD
jgi:Bacteriophage replication protein O